MCGIKNVLALGLLLATVYARPDGYGVKGGKPHRATVTARSSATANAEAIAGADGKSIAAAEATANAFTDGENIVKAISSATAIANPIGGSDDLGRSNDRKDTEYKSIDHQDGTPAWNRHIANAGHGGLDNNENSAPGIIGITGSSTVCNPGDLKCQNLKNKQSISNPHPTYNEHSDLTAGSSQPLPGLDGGSSNTANPGSRPCRGPCPRCSGSQPDRTNPNQSHQVHVALPADSGKPLSKPSISNLHPTFNEHPDLSAGGSSETLPNLDGGYGGTADEPSGPRPCTSAGSKCSGSQPGHSHPSQSQREHIDLPPSGSGRPVNKPSVSNPHPTYNKYPDLSAGSSGPLPNLNGGYGGDADKSGSRPCSSGSPKCSGSQRGDRSPDQSYPEDVDLPAGSGKPVNKPSVSNPYPTYSAHPDLSTGSSQPLPKHDGGYGEHKRKKPSQTIDEAKGGHQHNNNDPSVSDSHSNHHDVPNSRPCTLSGAVPCSTNQPPKSNPHPTYRKNSTSPGGSLQPLPELSHGCGSNAAVPGSRPCNSGSFVGRPENSNPFLNGEIKVSDIQKAVKSGGSSPGPSEVKTNPSNPFLNPHDGHVKPPTGTHHPEKPSSGDEAGSSDKYPEIKPNPFNPFLNPHVGHVKPPIGTHDPEKPSSGDEAGSFDKYPEIKPNPFNPFLNPNVGHVKPPTGTHHTEKPNGSDEAGSSDKYPEIKPNPSNPFLNPHDGHVRPPTGTHRTGNPSGSDESGLSNKYPETKPDPSNPFLKPRNQHPSTSAGGENPNDGNGVGPSDRYPKTKPDPPTNHRNQRPLTSDGHHLGNPNGGNDAGSFPRYPGYRENPANPSPSRHGQEDTVPCSLPSCEPEGPDAHSSFTDEFGNEKTWSPPSYGVKTHRAGVKGGAMGPGKGMITESDDSGNENKASVNSDASSGAYSKAHAFASSSAGAESSAYARSQAYSSADASGSSSWSSSGASASASAFSSSWH